MASEETREPDFLEEDPEIPGKRYALVSFVSPEEVIKNKELWMMSEFRRTYEVNCRLKCVEMFLSYMSQKYSIRFDDVLNEYEQFQKNHSTDPELTYSKMEEEYNRWLDENKEKKQLQWDKEHEFRTNVRGLKIRDVFGSLEEAKMRMKKYVTMDHGRIDLYCMEVGKWCAWHPSVAELQKQGKEVEYDNAQLNELMKKRVENELARDQLWQAEKDAKKRAALEETEKKKAANKALADAERTAAASTD